MNLRSKLLAALALLVSSGAMAQRGGVDCNWVGLTESYPIENGAVLSIGNRDSGCDTRGETPTMGIESLPQKRRVLQFLDPAQPPEDLYLRIGKTPAATTALRWQSIELRASDDGVPAGHRALVRERNGFVTLSTQYPMLFLTYVPGPAADPVVKSINVADLYEGDFLQLKITTAMEDQKTKITLQGLRGSHRLMLSARLGPVFPEIWQAEAPSLSTATTEFRVRLCSIAGLQDSGPCAIPRVGN